MWNIVLYLWMSTGFAESKSVQEAEYERLVSEMSMLSKNQAWSGVNKRFVEIEELGIPIQQDELLLGAQAAQELGNMYDAKERVTAALLLKEHKATRKWYTQLDTTYGQVTLVAKSKGNRALTRTDMTMDPVQAKALEYAQSMLDQKGEFRGLLPTGEYDFGGQQFLLTADMSIHLEISPKLRKKMLDEMGSH